MIIPNDTGDNVGISLPVGNSPGATLDIFDPNTGLAPSNSPTGWGQMIFRAMDNMYRSAIAVYGNIDGAPLADNTQGALAVQDVVGTGRSITTSGDIVIGGTLEGYSNQYAGTSILTTGTVGIGVEGVWPSPQAELQVFMAQSGVTQANAGAAIFLAQDGLGRNAIAAYGNIDGVPMADNTGTALAVGEQSGTGRSITTAGAIYAGNSAGAGPSIITIGSVGIGTKTPGSYMLNVNGSVFVAGYGALSDRRHKKDIEVYAGDALAQVNQLKPVTFLWKDPKDDGMKGKQIGFIAQDVQQVLPDAVMTMNNDEKTLSLKYDELIPVLTKAIQQLKAQNDKLASLVDAQGKEIKELKADNTKLNKQIGEAGVLKPGVKTAANQ